MRPSPVDVLTQVISKGYNSASQRLLPDDASSGNNRWLYNVQGCTMGRIHILSPHEVGAKYEVVRYEV